MIKRSRRPSLFQGTAVIICAVSIAVVVITIGPSLGFEQDPEPWPPEPNGTAPSGEVINGSIKYNKTYYGVPGRRAIFLFNKDPDASGNETRNVSLDHNLSNIGNTDNLTETEITHILRREANIDDFPWLYKPPVTIWNRNNFRAYQSVFVRGSQPLLSEANIIAKTDKEWSHYPVPKVKLEDGRHGKLLKDAHVTIFDVADSLRTYQGQGKDNLWIPRAGEIRAMIDHRAQEPTIYLNSNRTERLRYELNDINMTTCLVQASGASCNTSSNSKPLAIDQDATLMNSLQYGNLEQEVPPQGKLFYVADISAEYTETLEKWQDNGKGRPYWKIERTQEVSDTVTVEDSIKYRFWTRSKTVMNWSAVRFPNGSVGVKFLFSQKDPTETLPPAAWSALRVGPSRIDSEWRFISWRDGLWDSMKYSHESIAGGAYAPLATPLRTNLFPLQQPDTVSPHSPVEVVSTNTTELANRGLSVPTAELPTNVSVEFELGHPDRFNATNSLQVMIQNGSQQPYGNQTYDTSEFNGSKIDWTPIIPGQKTETNCPDPCISAAEPTKVIARYLERNGATHRFEIKVFRRNGTGEWVPLSGSNVTQPEIWLNGGTDWQLASTNLPNNGTTTVSINDRYVYQNIDVKFRAGGSVQYFSEKTYWLESTGEVWVPYNPELKSFFFYWLEVVIPPLLLFGVVYSWLKRDFVLKHI